MLDETEKFRSQSFYDSTETKDHHGSLGEAAEEQVLQAIDSFICVDSQKLCIESLPEVHACISASDTKRKHILLYEDVVDRAKELMKGQCCVYLNTVSNSNDMSNQHVGTIRCSIAYGRTLLSDEAGMDAW
jgi:hypothetical protein